MRRRPFESREGQYMDIILSNSSGVPIYEQIEEQIKSQIMSGDLVEGQLLPSMRVLAKDLNNVVINTLNKATLTGYGLNEPVPLQVLIGSLGGDNTNLKVLCQNSHRRQ